MKLLCLGDSNTYGYDPRSYFGSRYSESSCWTGLLDGWQVFNCGMNGLGVPADSNPWLIMIESKKPDLITVMLGSNDLLEGHSAVKTAKRMENFIQGILQCGIPILLIAPPIMQPGTWVQGEGRIQESSKLGLLYRELSRKMGTDFADAEEWNVELAFDGVHFTESGHKAFAKGLKRHLEEQYNEG